jgi:hypothetical protein
VEGVEVRRVNMNRIKGKDLPMEKCESCGKDFKVYSDFRGGDIGTRICMGCSNHRALGKEGKNV